MSEVTQIRARTVATLGVAAALVVGGVAAAQGSSDGPGSGSGGQPPRLGRPGPPPGMAIGPSVKGLTYGELHVQAKDGSEETIRIDQGKILKIDSSSLTLEENDGSEAKVALDSDTKVITGPPGSDSTIEDLAVGQEVVASGPEGEAAKAVTGIPKRGEMKVSPPSGQAPPPPPGA
jgi:hypothetical protein